MNKIEQKLEVLGKCSCGVNASIDEKMAAIEKLQGQYSIHVLCGALNLPRGTYYNRKRKANIKTSYEKSDEGIKPLLRQNCSESMFLHLSSSQLAEIKDELKFIEEHGAFDQEVFGALHLHTTWKILYYLSYLLHKQNEGKKTVTNNRQQILDTLEYLHQHFSEKITIDSLAERVYLSRSTFIRGFQAICGCSPIRYLTKYRIQKAMDLLENSTMSKTEIAHFCGFYDLSHMERSIKVYGPSH